MGRSWALSRPEPSSVYRKADFFIPLLVQTVATGGSLMLNMGPAADGSIPAMQQDILRQLGRWLDVNGVGIFNTTVRRAGTGERVVRSAAFPVQLAGMNNVEGVPVAGNLSSVVYLGKTATQAACEALCAAQAQPCLSYTWHDASVPGGYASMCYGHNDTAWAPVPESGHYSGRRDACDVSYTVGKTTGHLFAFFDNYRAGPLVLTHPRLAADTPPSAAAVQLLGAGPAGSDLALPFEPQHGRAGVTVTLPPLDPMTFSATGSTRDLFLPVVFGLRLVGFE